MTKTLKEKEARIKLKFGDKKINVFYTEDVKEKMLELKTEINKISDCKERNNIKNWYFENIGDFKNDTRK